MGEFGLSYDEFLDLTPWQWALLCEGKRKQEQRRMLYIRDCIAWQTAHLMNATGNFKKPVTVEMLLDTKSADETKPEGIDFNEVSKWVKQ